MDYCGVCQSVRRRVAASGLLPDDSTLIGERWVRVQACGSERTCSKWRCLLQRNAPVQSCQVLSLRPTESRPDTGRKLKFPRGAYEVRFHGTDYNTCHHLERKHEELTRTAKNSNDLASPHFAERLAGWRRPSRTLLTHAHAHPCAHGNRVTTAHQEQNSEHRTPNRTLSPRFAGPTILKTQRGEVRLQDAAGCAEARCAHCRGGGGRPARRHHAGGHRGACQGDGVRQAGTSHTVLLQTANGTLLVNLRVFPLLSKWASYAEAPARAAAAALEPSPALAHDDDGWVLGKMVVQLTARGVAIRIGRRRHAIASRWRGTVSA